MDPIIFNDIPFTATFEELAESSRVKKGSQHEATLKGLFQEAQNIARPKAMYKVASIDEKMDQGVVMDGIKFQSRILRVNLNDVHRAFPYIATCGSELHEWHAAQDDMITQYNIGTICELALKAARAFLQDHLEETYHLEESSYMNPGSLEDWPIREQRNLFQLLGNPESAIGVKLQPSLMMTPSQTVSGIRFASEASFQSCQLCPMDNCPHRKAPYDPDLYEQQFS